MFYIFLGVFCVVYGIMYAANPMKSLEKKYAGDEVPKIAVRTARISGVVIAAVGAVVAVYNFIQL